nr:tandem-95 repeat protein [uncultured Noviherbaspirillum sp.]
MATRTGTIGNDTLVGTTANDTLIGLDGNDHLDGRAGADMMDGGKGNDTYIVDNAGDAVVEKAGEGSDLVLSAISYTLTVNVENLTLTGTANNRATGNAMDNIITGNSGANELNGGSGNDTLNGHGGNDVLDGGIGADILAGGADNDRYIVDDVLDIVTENAGGGALDIIQSAVSFSTPLNVEGLILTGANAIDGTGNALGNILTGNNVSNTLNGLGGNDVLYGAGGNDTLLYSLTENGGAFDVYGGGNGSDTLRLIFTGAEWANAAVQSEVARYNQYLDARTEEIGDLALFTFNFGNSTRVVLSGTEKLDVQVDGSTVDFRAPTITAAIASGAILESPPSAGITKLGASGEISFSDLDYNGTHATTSPVALVSSGLPEGQRGTLTASVVNDTVGVGDTTGKVTWTYEIDNASVRYLNAGETAAEVFNVVIVDNTGKSAVQQVTVTVTGTNGMPLSSNDAGYSVNEDGALTVAAAQGVLANDTDADGDALAAAIQDGPAHGTLALAGDGSFVYTPDADFFGSDSFTYRANDGSASSELATAAIEVVAVNDAPVAADKTIAQPNTITHVFNISDFGYADADQDSFLNVKIDGLPQLGKLANAGGNVSVGDVVSATDIAAGKLVFTPSRFISGNDNKIVFQVQDDGGTSNGGLDTSLVPNVFNVQALQSFKVFEGLLLPDSIGGKAPVTISQETDSLAGFLNFFSENYAFTSDKVIDLFIPVTGDPFTFQVLPGTPTATDYKLASISELLDDTIPTLAPPVGSSINSSGKFTWTPTAADIGKEYYFNVQTIANDADDSIFDFTPLDLADSVAIRAHAYKPAASVTPGTQVVLIPYDGTADQPVPGTNDSISISSITIDSNLTGTAPFSINPGQNIPITLIESSLIFVVPQSQITSTVALFDQYDSLFVTDPVTASPTPVPYTKILHTNPTFDNLSLGTPNLVDSPVGLISDLYNINNLFAT